MIYAEPFFDEFVLRRHHVVVIVLREMGAHPVARLTRFAVADAVGKDDEVAARIEKLPRSEQHAGKDWLEESTSLTTGPVQNQDGIRHVTLAIVYGCANRLIVQ